jgi:hypothetical protein
MLEGEIRADHQVLDGLREEDFGGRGERGHPCADVHGEATDLAADAFGLAGVQSGSDLDSERADGIGDRSCTADPVPGEQCSDERVMLLNELCPAGRAEAALRPRQRLPPESQHRSGAAALVRRCTSGDHGRQRLPMYVSTPNTTAAKAMPSTSHSAFTAGL